MKTISTYINFSDTKSFQEGREKVTVEYSIRGNKIILGVSTHALDWVGTMHVKSTIRRQEKNSDLIIN